MVLHESVPQADRVFRPRVRCRPEVAVAEVAIGRARVRTDYQI
jgi:hypothetical protein